MPQVVWGGCGQSIATPQSSFPLMFQCGLFPCAEVSGKTGSMGSQQAAVPSGHVHVLPQGPPWAAVWISALPQACPQAAGESAPASPPPPPFSPTLVSAGLFLTLVISLFCPLLDIFSRRYQQLLFTRMQSSTPGVPSLASAALEVVGDPSPSNPPELHTTLKGKMV